MENLCKDFKSGIFKLKWLCELTNSSILSNLFSLYSFSTLSFWFKWHFIYFSFNTKKVAYFKWARLSNVNLPYLSCYSSQFRSINLSSWLIIWLRLNRKSCKKIVLCHSYSWIVLIYLENRHSKSSLFLGVEHWPFSTNVSFATCIAIQWLCSCFCKNWPTHINYIFMTHSLLLLLLLFYHFLLQSLTHSF